MSNSAMLTDSTRVIQRDGGEILQALQGTPLLQGVAEPVLERLAAISQIVVTPEEQELCQQGEPADQLFIVLEGQMAGFSTAANGTTAVVEVIREFRKAVEKFLRPGGGLGHASKKLGRNSK